ncbi:dihydrodipicolinate synthase family protein [Olivibacter jilunii]|uniref:dihydrodipicolinate synthase family protein n=1 Tax=Olivibacter jilunii TaxID=985016 RepID=UPI0010325C53|nr:dihydrodipicolinate synthase family protein [Olivibacter jilunii]
MLTKEKRALLQEGTVIPAHPLALTAKLDVDEEKQRNLTHYYINSGVGGIAVGVHTTQFEIRDPRFNLYETVLRFAAEEIADAGLNRPFIKVAGICGPTAQALQEAELAIKYNYDLALLSLGGLNDWTDDQLITHVKAVAARIPVIGFYLQPAVGGRLLSYHFWEQFAQIEGVEAIKVASFNRYQTLDVVRAVCTSPRSEDIALYTGNDDNIVADLLTPYKFLIDGTWKEKRFVGGLLGHWAVWTETAVKLHQQIKHCIANQYQGVEDLLRLGVQVTDMNAALFDVSHNFKGSIAGIHEVLRRNGLMEGIWCLSPKEILSPGQLEELDRVIAAYPHLSGAQPSY